MSYKSVESHLHPTQTPLALPSHGFQVTFIAGSGDPKQQPSTLSVCILPPSAANRLQEQFTLPSPSPLPRYPASSPKQPRAPLQPFLHSLPRGGCPLSPPRNPQALSAPTSKFLTAPAFKESGKKDHDITAGLFGFVCLLVGAIKYSWKVNVPHTGEV